MTLSAEMTCKELGDGAMIVVGHKWYKGEEGSNTPPPTPANFGDLDKVISELLLQHSDLDPLNRLQHYKLASSENNICKELFQDRR